MQAQWPIGPEEITDCNVYALIDQNAHLGETHDRQQSKFWKTMPFKGKFAKITCSVGIDSQIFHSETG